MNLQENISRIKEVMGLNHEVLVEQLGDPFKNKKSSKGFFIINLFKILSHDAKSVPTNPPNLDPKATYYFQVNMKNISNEKLPIIIESVKFNDENRIGDHICYYSDLSKMKEHYPQFNITKNLNYIIENIYKK
jgi:hypothetical protein